MSVPLAGLRTLRSALPLVLDQPRASDQAPGFMGPRPRRRSIASVSALMTHLARDHDLSGEVLGATGGVVASESVGKNVGEAELLLRHEAAVAVTAFEHQVHDRSDSGRGRYLDRRPQPPGDHLGIDLV